MSFLRRLFGGQDKPASPKRPPSEPIADPPSSRGKPTRGPIKVRDAYGRELEISNDEFRDKVLLANLDQHKDDPDRLYSMLESALEDGFAGDVVAYAEHLAQIDPDTARATTMLGVVYLELGRLADAERVLRDHLTSHGEDGYVLANLARVLHQQGDAAGAEATMWHALEVDPNQNNGVSWYASLHQERDGREAALEACRRASELPGCWRAYPMLIQDALDRGDLASAEQHCGAALERVGRPVPEELLVEVSLGLGNAGHLEELVRVVEPHFDSEHHGLMAGSNLIRAYLSLERSVDARRILEGLRRWSRDDWREHLDYLEGELVESEHSSRGPSDAKDLKISFVPVRGPVWANDNSPFAETLPEKREDAVRIAVVGSCVVSAEPGPGAQVVGPAGRISRAVPLVLAERIHLCSDAKAAALIPWTEGRGFSVFPFPPEDADLCTLVALEEDTPEFVIGVILSTDRSPWRIDACVVRTSDKQRIAKTEVSCPWENPGPFIQGLSVKLLDFLTANTSVLATDPPPYYALPGAESLSHYQACLEQQLEVRLANDPGLVGGAIHAAGSILEHALHLCVEYPTNQLLRVLFAQTLLEMRAVRREVVREFAGKTRRLLAQHPIPAGAGMIAGSVVEIILDEVQGTADDKAS